jgi:2-C-methyl-D-erythritol 4-phosphate cytidylyltransferase
MKKYAIIVAGGSGSRMGAPIAKQYLEIGGKPVLMHTLRRFFDYSAETEIILVLPEKDHKVWEELCRVNLFEVPHKVVAGGDSRFQSVRNGLAAIEGEEGLVAIHDGVRPFVSIEIIEKSFESAAETGSGIVVVPLKDSIRKVNESGVSTFEDRQAYRLVQTPQTFDLHKIKEAFRVEEQPFFTDDATVYEYQGWTVSLVEGDPSNIKITTPEDMDYAEYYLSRR